MRTLLCALLLGLFSSGAAETVFYVNTGSTAGGDGTTSATVGANRAFASLREAITSTGTHISAPRLILCSGATADTLNVIQAHWDTIDTTPVNYLRIRGDNTTGKWNTSAYHMVIQDENALYNNNPGHVRIENLQVQLTVTTSSGSTYNCYRLSTQNVGAGRNDCDCRMSGCIARMVEVGTDNIAGFYNSAYAETPGGTMRLFNCIAYGGYTGFGAAWSSVTHYNCTAYGNEFNFMDPMVVINCLSASPTVGNGFESVGTGGGLSDYNASSDSSAVGTHKRINQTFTFVSTAGEDFHLAAADAGARNYGVSNPGSGLFADDVDGQTRNAGAWDIGADEYMVILTNSDATNRIDWTQCGVPGGIPVRNTIYTTLASSSTAAQINTAIANCPSNQVVKLGAGTFTVSASIDFASAKGVTLRGSGVGQTILSSSVDQTIKCDQYSMNGGNTAISSGYTKGSTNIVVASASGFEVGNVMMIWEDDVTNLVFKTQGFNSDVNLAFLSKITAINSTTITFWPPLPYTLQSYLNPKAAYQSGGPGIIRCGIEDLTIKHPTANDDTIYLDAATECWVKNVEISNVVNVAIYLIDCLNCEVRHCYLHDANGWNANQEGYGVYVYDKSSFCLVEDNIFSKLFVGPLVSGASANAFLYNFVTNGGAQSFNYQVGAINANHGCHPMMNLWEGNVSEQFQIDGYHGSASHQTIFRNWFHGLSTYTGNRKCVDLCRANYYCYVSGNVLGNASWTNDTGFAYEMAGDGPEYTDQSVIYRLGYPNMGNNSYEEGNAWPTAYGLTYPDQNVTNTLVRHGNYDFANHAQVWDSGIADHTLANSLFYPSKPSYFGALAWPAFDPASPLSASPLNIPAGYRFYTGNDPSSAPARAARANKAIGGTIGTVTH